MSETPLRNPRSINPKPLRKVPKCFKRTDGERWYRLRYYPDYAVSHYGRVGRLKAGRGKGSVGLIAPKTNFFRKTVHMRVRLYADGKAVEVSVPGLVHSIREFEAGRAAAMEVAVGTRPKRPNLTPNQFNWLLARVKATTDEEFVESYRKCIREIDGMLDEIDGAAEKAKAAAKALRAEPDSPAAEAAVQKAELDLENVDRPPLTALEVWAELSFWQRGRAVRGLRPN